MSFKRTAVGQHLSLSAPNEDVHDEKEKSKYDFKILRTFSRPTFGDMELCLYETKRKLHCRTWILFR